MAFDSQVGEEPKFDLVCTFAKALDESAFLISIPMKDAKKLSGLPISSLRSIILIHDQMLRVLTEAAFDQTFWSRIKLA